MMPAISYALSALYASDTRLGVHGNNLANLNTTGFKSSRALQATAPGGGTKTSSIQQNFSQGPLQVTGYADDYAIAGDGFFALQNGHYTRDGSFTRNANGDLVNAEGELAFSNNVYSFANPNGLIQGGGNVFAASSVSGVAIPTSSEIVQGSLEGSNVDIATEMVGIMYSRRAFEINLKMVRTSDELLGTLLDIAA